MYLKPPITLPNNLKKIFHATQLFDLTHLFGIYYTFASSILENMEPVLIPCILLYGWPMTVDLVTRSCRLL